MYSGRKYFLSRLVCLLSAILFVALDQVTKLLAVRHLKGGEPFVVIEGVLRFVYVENRGAAFGSFAGQRWIFMIVSIAAIVGITVFVLYKRNLSGFYLMCLTFVFAGGVGNMIDRVLLGYVVDFIDFYFVDFAVFNIADSFVTVGALLLIYILAYEIYRDEKKKKQK